MQLCTTEYFFDGTLEIQQPENGYRFSMDPFVLSDHARPVPGQRIMDIGTGVGIIPLLLCRKTKDLDITAVEIQEALALTAIDNIRLNHREKEISIVHGDVTQMHTPKYLASQDMVITNPPYRKYNHGRINPHPQKAMARHELTLTLEQLVESASKFLKPNGIFHTIYPVDRLPEFMDSLTKKGLTPETLKFIHPRKTEKAKLFIMTAKKCRHCNFSVQPPLYPHTTG